MEEPYRYETLPLDTPDSDPLWAEYLDVFNASFLGERAADESVAKFRQYRRDARAKLDMITTQGPGAPERRPIAGFNAAPFTHNAGAGVVDTWVINTIGVRSSHRRRGLLSEMMRRQLTHAAEAGFATAVLTSSEGGIYGRFGFGPANRTCSIEIDCARFKYLPTVAVADGVVEFCLPSVLAPDYDRITRAHQETHRGAHGRLLSHREAHLGEHDRESGGPNRKLRAVGLWRDGALAGYATFRATEKWGETVMIHEIVSDDSAVDRRLVQALVDIDLVKTLTYGWSHPRDPLPLSLVDPRAVTIKETEDGIWLRILHLPNALRQRGWDADGEVVLDVRDPMGFADGRWKLTVSNSTADVARLPAAEPVGPAAEPVEAPVVSMGVDVLALLYFGDRTVAECSDAGLVSGNAQAIADASRLFQVHRPPVNLAGF